MLATCTSVAFCGKIWENHADAAAKLYYDCPIVVVCMLSREIWIAGDPGTEILRHELDT